MVTGARVHVEAAATQLGVSVGAWLDYAERAAYPIDDYRQIRRWYAGLIEMPAWRESIVAPPF